jgi:hypothetical protein
MDSSYQLVCNNQTSHNNTTVAEYHEHFDLEEGDFFFLYVRPRPKQ